MKLKLIATIIALGVLSSCGNNEKKENSTAAPAEAKPTTETTVTDPMQDKGVGPITSVTIGDLDQKLADQGQVLFKAKCSACHKIEKRYIGPALTGVTKKQSPEWIMNMMLNPEVMIVENATAKALLAEYSAPMANQHLTQDEARAIYEYLRTQNPN